MAQTTTYCCGDGDRIAGVDGVSYTYDSWGNLTCDGTWTYTPWCVAACREAA